MPWLGTRSVRHEPPTVVVDRDRVVEEVHEVDVVGPTERAEETTVMERVDPVVQRDRVVYGGRVERNLAVERSQAIHRAGQLIGLLFGVIEGLIAIRLVLALLGANPTSAFATFIHAVTGPLVAPFVGLMASPEFGTSVVDVPSLVALVVYAMLGWVVIRAVMLIFAGPESRRLAEVERHRHEDEI